MEWRCSSYVIRSLVGEWESDEGVERVCGRVAVSVGGVGHMTGLLALVEVRERLLKSNMECCRKVRRHDSFFSQEYDI